MANKTLLDALKAIGKATHREIATHLGIGPVEALNMLREEREQGRCEFSNGTWWVAGVDLGNDDVSTPRGKTLPPEPASEVVDRKAIEKLLRENGAMDTVSLAKALNRKARGVTSTMSGLARRGDVVKIGQGKGCKWSLPSIGAGPASSVVDAGTDNPASVEKDSQTPTAPVLMTEQTSAVVDAEEMVKSIPSFTEGQSGCLLIPAPAEIARMIRKAKHNLRELEQIRQISIAVKKHSKTLARIAALKREE